MEERRGLVVLRERGEGFVDASSSTSNDLFSAVPVGLVASPLSGLLILPLPLMDLAIPDDVFFIFS